MEQKTAFIAIVGKPNVGKSSLLNAILGQKVAIVSKKPQTTRTRITGVLTREEIQLVFIDTPGLHKPQNRLGDYMVKSIAESVSGVDACVLVVQAGEEIQPAEAELIATFKKQDIPALLVLNKMDTAKEQEKVASQIKAFTDEFNFEGVIPTSAINNEGIETVLEVINKFAQPGPHFFDDDALTDQPEKVLASEIIREKLLRLLEQEIPHGIAVGIEKMKERENSEITDIDAIIYCEKDSHKGIVIGKGGAMLKKVATYAREDMEKFFGCKINLKVWVKVKEGWRNRDNLLRSFGFDENQFS